MHSHHSELLGHPHLDNKQPIFYPVLLGERQALLKALGTTCFLNRSYTIIPPFSDFFHALDFTTDRTMTAASFLVP